MGGGGIFSFSYMDDSKIPAAFKKEKKRKETRPLKQKFHRKLRARFQIHMTGTKMTDSTRKSAIKACTHLWRESTRTQEQKFRSKPSEKKKKHKNLRGTEQVTPGQPVDRQCIKNNPHPPIPQHPVPLFALYQSGH